MSFQIDEKSDKSSKSGFEVDLSDYIEIIKRCRCHTSPNGNYQLYNVFSGDIIHYEWKRETFPYFYRVYRKYDSEDETKCVYVDLSHEVFMTYFKPVN